MLLFLQRHRGAGGRCDATRRDYSLTTDSTVEKEEEEEETGRNYAAAQTPSLISCLFLCRVAQLKRSGHVLFQTVKLFIQAFFPLFFNLGDQRVHVLLCFLFLFCF